MECRMTEFVMIAALVIGTVATVSAANEQKKAARAQQRQQELQTQRSQRQAIREAQIRRSQSLATTQGMGVVGGSGVSGGVASLGSTLGGSLGYAGQMSGLATQQSIAQSNANTYGAIADLGFSAASFGTKFII